MKGSRFTEEQIIGVLREQEAGAISDSLAVVGDSDLFVNQKVVGSDPTGGSDKIKHLDHASV